MRVVARGQQDIRTMKLIPFLEDSLERKKEFQAPKRPPQIRDMGSAIEVNVYISLFLFYTVSCVFSIYQNKLLKPYFIETNDKSLKA